MGKCNRVSLIEDINNLAIMILKSTMEAKSAVNGASLVRFS